MTVTHLISELLDAVGDATTPSPAFWGFKVFLLKKEIRWKSLDREKRFQVKIIRQGKKISGENH